MSSLLPSLSRKLVVGLAEGFSFRVSGHLFWTVFGFSSIWTFGALFSQLFHENVFFFGRDNELVHCSPQGVKLSQQEYSQVYQI